MYISLDDELVQPPRVQTTTSNHFLKNSKHVFMALTILQFHQDKQKNNMPKIFPNSSSQ